jgi:hypothetical protein
VLVLVKRGLENNWNTHNKRIVCVSVIPILYAYKKAVQEDLTAAELKILRSALEV